MRQERVYSRRRSAIPVRSLAEALPPTHPMCATFPILQVSIGVQRTELSRICTETAADAICLRTKFGNCVFIVHTP